MLLNRPRATSSMSKIYHCSQSHVEAIELQKFLVARNINLPLVCYQPMLPEIDIQITDIVFCGYGEYDVSFILSCHRLGCCVLKPKQHSDIGAMVAEWLKLFPGEPFAEIYGEPRHISNLSRTFHEIGSTLGPRALVLNKENETKSGTVKFERGAHVGADLLLNTAASNVVFGRFSMVSSGFTAHSYSHAISHLFSWSVRRGVYKNLGDSVEPRRTCLTIGSDTWIGSNVTLIGGGQVSDGVVIGASSVLTKPTEPYGIYAGVPARLIRFRFPDDVIEVLLHYKWWNWEYSHIILLNKLRIKLGPNIPSAASLMDSLEAILST